MCWVAATQAALVSGRTLGSSCPTAVEENTRARHVMVELPLHAINPASLQMNASQDLGSECEVGEKD